MLVDNGEGCKHLVARIVEIAVRDAGASDPELAGEAYGWLTNGGLTWACRWLDLDRGELLTRLEDAGMLPPACYQPELAGLDPPPVTEVT